MEIILPLPLIVPATDEEVDSLNQTLNDRGIKITYTNKESDKMIWTFLINVLPYIILIGAMYFVFRNLNGAAGGNAKAFEFGNSRAKLERMKDKIQRCCWSRRRKRRINRISRLLEKP